MARSHGKIYAGIWGDPEFRALTGAAQRAYFVLLSQPKLTLCGSIDMAVTKWARLAADTTVASFDQSLAELQEAEFVIVDSDVDELLIRTFTKHDINAKSFNVNLCKGLWGAWRALLSDYLKRVVITEMPEELWQKVLDFAPKEAVMCRELTRPETGRLNGASEQTDPTDRQNAPSERTV